MIRIYVEKHQGGELSPAYSKISLSSNFCNEITNNYFLEKEKKEIPYRHDKDKTVTVESEFLECARINFFIGQNNSGKSRFLRALISSPLLAWYEVHKTDETDETDEKTICFIGNDSSSYPRKKENKETQINVIDKIYIPILRGLRPINGNKKLPYVERTRQDYFSQMIQVQNDSDKIMNKKQFTDWGVERKVVS